MKFKHLGSLCRYADCFEYNFVGSPKDRFSCNKAHLMKHNLYHVIMTNKMSSGNIMSLLTSCLLGFLTGVRHLIASADMGKPEA